MSIPFAWIVSLIVAAILLLLLEKCKNNKFQITKPQFPL